MKVRNTIFILLASLISGICSISPAYATKMKPDTTPPNPDSPDEPPSVVLPMEAKQPGDYNFQASVTSPLDSVAMQGFGPGKLGLITPVILNGLKYIDLATGQQIPPPFGTSRPSRRLPPEPLPEPIPEPMAPPPPPQDHGRIMSVGRDPDNPGAFIITYQDGTIERIFPPQK